MRQDEILLEKILKDVEKPGRYLGGEWNERKKNPLAVKTKVALVFPDAYEIGMSYLGQKILYSLLNDQPSILAERVFAPWPDFEQKLRSTNMPLYSLENKIPLAQFDILGFSLLYELNYSNILTILDLGCIPLLSAERTLDFPLIIAGGPAAFNPEPVADFFDLFLVGDGEEAFLEIIERCRSLKQQGKLKPEILADLAKLRGVYVPSLYNPYLPPQSSLLALKPKNGAPPEVAKRVLFPFHHSYFPEKILVPNIKVVFDRVAVEVARGCPQRCRFCQATSLYSPHRVKSPSFVIQKILGGLRSTGYEGVSLFSLSVSDYPYFNETVEALMGKLAKENISLSLSSLRPKGLSPDIVQNIIRVRKTGFTLVPEAGTERLRRVINKNLKDQDILEAAANAFSQGWRLLKLYFMIGLPQEREEDLQAIVSLVREIISLGRKILNSPPGINLSLSSFIPKPHTAFQWLAMEEEESLLEKQKFIKSYLRRNPSIKIKEHSVKNSVLEAVFSRGDRRLAGVLRSAWERGARFDSWKDQSQFLLWEEAFRFHEINHRIYLGSLDRDARLPWDHIQTGVKKSYLLKELDKALREETTPSCLETKCGLCQGCDFWNLLEREFPERLEIRSEELSPLGEKKEKIFRYQAQYAKVDQARFFSHRDLINVLQRVLRRARIEVVHSHGHHPKMLLSFVPALPLGMEGKEEAFEFKSSCEFEEREFLARVNQSVPTGIQFLSLKKLGNSLPSLNGRIQLMVYSLDLGAAEIENALRTIGEERKLGFARAEQIVRTLIQEYFHKKDEAVQNIVLDEERKRLFFYIKYSPSKILRPQDVVENIFGIKDSVYFLTREKIVYSTESLTEKSDFDIT